MIGRRWTELEVQVTHKTARAVQLSDGDREGWFLNECIEEDTRDLRTGRVYVLTVDESVALREGLV